jgi:hypothetical protein
MEMTPEVFASLAGNTEIWKLLAEQLIHGAEILRKAGDEAWQEWISIPTTARSSPDLEPLRLRMYQSRTALLLYACGTENLLKGLIVLGRSPVETTNKGVRLTIDTHDLCSLADELDIAWSPAERQCFERLSKVVKWSGRYAVPTKANDFTESTGLLLLDDVLFLINKLRAQYEV